MDVLNIRELVLNVRKPLILKNISIPWKCFQVKPQEWCKDFDEGSEDKLHIFNKANVPHSDSPQWEKYCGQISMSCEDFYLESTGTMKNDKEDVSTAIFEEHWASLNYQNCSRMPINCKNGISFSCFGFPTDEEECTFWLGTKNAHTSCHFDSYGCNIVVQVFGRKQWLLFPSETPFSAIRVPYEESSVYCSENFYSPSNLHQFSKIKDMCHSVILEPGDVLVVPRNWWHYVENLETSLSVNAWIPLEIDIEAQLDECIVKYIIENFVKNQSDDEKVSILNPNQLNQIGSDKETLGILQYLANEVNNTERSKKINQKKYPYMYLPLEQVDELLKSFDLDVQYVNTISSERFLKLMEENGKRYSKSVESNASKSSGSELTTIKELLINSICHSSIVKNIRNLFLNNYAKATEKP